MPGFSRASRPTRFGNVYLFPIYLCRPPQGTGLGRLQILFSRQMLTNAKVSRLIPARESR